jgi:hypothetical protein
MALGANIQAKNKTSVKPFPYSAIVRNGAGQLMTNDTINLQVSILAQSLTGPRIYRENHHVITAADGSFTITVGDGESGLGQFNNIDWLGDAHFLSIAMDADGGNNYQPWSVTQIVAVGIPVQDKKDDKKEEEEVDEHFTHYLGEQFGGGTIFHIFRDSTGAEHGLIVSAADVAPAAQWSNISSRFIGTNVNKMDGNISTDAIIKQEGHTTSAAQLTRAYNGGGYTDWYLPGIDELQLLWDSKDKIAKKKAKDSNYKGSAIMMGPIIYWSSTEYNADEAMTFDFNSGTAKSGYKYAANYLRAVRKF